MVSRFEVRLNQTCREQLDKLAESKGITAAEYEEALREHRLQAAEELIAMNAETPPDPAELSRLMEAAHDVCGIC